MHEGEFRVLDTTLRDGEQTPGISLTSEEKLWIARQLDSMGVDTIEAGSVATSEGERRGIGRVADEGLEAEVASYCRALDTDIEQAAGCGVDAVHLVLPSSRTHIEEKLGRTGEEVLDLATEMTELSRDHGLVVELSAEDASRADTDFLEQLYGRGVEAGTDRLVFCDTVGVLTPRRTSSLFERLSGSFEVPLAVHCHNDFGNATSNTVEALLSGASEVHVTVNGIGERAGNASLEEVVSNASALNELACGVDMGQLYEASRLVSRLTGMPIALNKPIVGENAFTHESGVHVHGMLRDESTYEPITPEAVGRKRRFVLGKHIGRSSVRAYLGERGVEASEEQVVEITERVKDLSDKGKLITDADVEAIAETVLKFEKEPVVRLEDLTVVSGNKVTPTASVRLNIDDETVDEASTGVGPVDAPIRALRKAIKGMADIQLENYRVEAITGGTDALVEVVIKLSRDGRIVTAHGARADIIMASVEAMIDGVNRLLEEEA
ncbi:MAG: (R)-citramalate synthase CimA [Methanonatronarchaeales archaeon]|nr:(R)-citramalate synthase CimA [Methanonatronarchaeales archaeon]